MNNNVCCDEQIARKIRIKIGNWQRLNAHACARVLLTIEIIVICVGAHGTHEKCVRDFQSYRLHALDSAFGPQIMCCNVSTNAIHTHAALELRVGCAPNGNRNHEKISFRQLFRHLHYQLISTDERVKRTKKKKRSLCISIFVQHTHNARRERERERKTHTPNFNPSNIL